MPCKGKKYDINFECEKTDNCDGKSIQTEISKVRIVNFVYYTDSGNFRNVKLWIHENCFIVTQFHEVNFTLPNFPKKKYLDEIALSNFHVVNSKNQMHPAYVTNAMSALLWFFYCSKNGKQFLFDIKLFHISWQQGISVYSSHDMIKIKVWSDDKDIFLKLLCKILYTLWINDKKHVQKNLLN